MLTKLFVFCPQPCLVCRALFFAAGCNPLCNYSWEWMAPASASELMRIQSSASMSAWRPVVMRALVHHLTPSWPLPRHRQGGRGVKPQRNPGDFIHLHFPPAGLCRVSISLCSATSLHLWNETSREKTSCWVRLTHNACQCKTDPACVHAWANTSLRNGNTSHECEEVI